MRAGQAAAAAGVTVKALRYYEQNALVRPRRLTNGYREYSAEDVRLVGQVRALMSLGLSLKETEPFVQCLREGHDVADDCPESVSAYQDKIDRLDGLIAQLQRDRDELGRRMRLAARRGFRSALPTEQTGAVSLPQADPLPVGLPVPADDGGARHLPGRRLPPLTFTGTDGQQVRLDAVSAGRWVLYLYPLTGEPGVDVPRGWNEIPGARGCTQQACSFRDHLSALQAAGAEQVLALSSDAADYQQDLADRLHLPYPMLSDPQLQLARALDLPTFHGDGDEGDDGDEGGGGGTPLYKRLTMVLRGDRIEHVFYPIFPPDTHAEQVLDWLRTHPTQDQAEPARPSSRARPGSRA